MEEGVIVGDGGELVEDGGHGNGAVDGLTGGRRDAVQTGRARAFLLG